MKDFDVSLSTLSLNVTFVMSVRSVKRLNWSKVIGVEISCWTLNGNRAATDNKGAFD